MGVGLNNSIENANAENEYAAREGRSLQTDSVRGHSTVESKPHNSSEDHNLADTQIDLIDAKRKIEEGKLKLATGGGSFQDFKALTLRLNKFDLFTISRTADYLRVFLPRISQPDRDSTYLYFVRTFYGVVNNLSDSLSIKFPRAMNALEEGREGSQTRDLREYLRLFGVGIFMTEGVYYLDVEHDYFLSIFEKQVSNGLKAYLVQRNHELNEGFAEDGGLIISLDKVYDRVLKWERIVSENPGFLMLDDSRQYYRVYLETLLTGMDNSRVFDLENGELYPEVKELYEFVVKSGPKTQSTEIIQGYYTLLAENGFRYSEKLEDYLSKNGLKSMLGVQPHWR